MPINLESVLPQALAGGVSVTVTELNPAPAEPGHVSYRTWMLQVNNGNQASLNGQPVKANWAQAGPLFHKGANVNAPMPETGWLAFSTIIGGGFATGTLNSMPSNPSYLTLGN